MDCVKESKDLRHATQIVWLALLPARFYSHLTGDQAPYMANTDYVKQPKRFMHTPSIVFFGNGQQRRFKPHAWVLTP